MQQFIPDRRNAPVSAPDSTFLENSFDITEYEDIFDSQKLSDLVNSFFADAMVDADLRSVGERGVYHVPKSVPFESQHILFEMKLKMQHGDDCAEEIEALVRVFDALFRRYEDTPAPDWMEEDEMQKVDRESSNEYMRAKRNADVTLREYRMIQKLNMLLEALRALGSQAQQEYIRRQQHGLVDIAKKVVGEDAGILSVEAFGHIIRSGKEIDRSPEAPLQDDQIALVTALSGHVPMVKNNQVILRSGFDAGVSNRNSIHLSANHMVEPHAQASWQGAPAVIVMPYALVAEEHTPIAFNEVDTYFFGEELALPKGSVILVDDTSPQWKQWMDTNTELFNRYTILRVKDREHLRAATNVALLRMGYSVIRGGDYHSHDRVTAEKFAEYRESHDFVEGGVNHFYGDADRIDMVHGLIQLDRFAQLGGARDVEDARSWVDKVDWTDRRGPMQALREIHNGLAPKSLLEYITDLPVEKYNLSEERRDALYRGAVMLLETIDPLQAIPEKSTNVPVEDQDRYYSHRSARTGLIEMTRGLVESYRRLQDRAKAGDSAAEAGIVRIQKQFRSPDALLMLEAHASALQEA